MDAVRYRLYADRLVNMLTHPSQRGRDNILWIQSMISPLQRINDQWQSWVRMKTIEANVTSQVFHFEWYLNYRFSQYIKNDGERITFAHYIDWGVPVFSAGELGEILNMCWGETENASGAPQNEKPKPLFFEYESVGDITASFKINIPEITITKEEFDIMLRAEVERYRLAGKTYAIQHTE